MSGSGLRSVCRLAQRRGVLESRKCEGDDAFGVRLDVRDHFARWALDHESVCQEFGAVLHGQRQLAEFISECLDPRISHASSQSNNPIPSSCMSFFLFAMAGFVMPRDHLLTRSWPTLRVAAKSFALPSLTLPFSSVMCSAKAFAPLESPRSDDLLTPAHNGTPQYIWSTPI